MIPKTREVFGLWSSVFGLWSSVFDLRDYEFKKATSPPPHLTEASGVPMPSVVFFEAKSHFVNNFLNVYFQFDISI